MPRARPGPQRLALRLPRRVALKLSGWRASSAVAALLFALHLASARGSRGAPAEEEAPLGPLRALLGPCAGLAAELEWVRFSRARGAGRAELALAHAESAVELDPSAPEGYDRLATHLAFDLGSAASEPDPAERRAWLCAALAVAAQGERASRNPAALAFLQGYLLHVKAETDPDLGWPGGAEALLRTAAEHYRRAAARGWAAAGPFARYAAERAGG